MARKKKGVKPAVGGDSIQTGDMEKSKAIAIGREAQALNIESSGELTVAGKDAIQGDKYEGASIELVAELAKENGRLNEKLRWERKASKKRVAELEQLIHVLESAEAIRLIQQAEEQINAKRWDALRDVAEELLKLLPEWGLGHVVRGIAYREQGEEAKAIADYTEAIRLNPKLTDAHFNRGNAYFRQGEQAKAIADFSEVIRLDPQDAAAYINRGAAYHEQAEQLRAIADYTEAMRLDPKLAIAHYNRGNVYAEQGKWSRAIEDYTAAMRLDPNNAWFYVNRGATYANQGELAKAIADLSEAIRLDPKLAMAYNNRGNARREQGEYAKAIADLNRAIRLDPKNAMAYNNRGLTYAQQGERAKAIINYTKAIRLDPKYAVAYFNRGATYVVKGEFTKAIMDLDEAIRLDPKIAAAYLFRARAHSQLGNIRQAVADYRRFMAMWPNDDDMAAFARQQIAELEVMAISSPNAGLILNEEKSPIRLDADGTARVGQTRVTLDTLIHAYQAGTSAEDLARQYPTLSQADIYGTLAYYLRHRAEVDAYLQKREVQARQIREKIEAEFDPAGVRERLEKRRKK